MWKAEIYIQPDSRWFAKSKLKHISATEHTDGSFSITAEDKRYVTKVCDRYRLKCLWYKTEWTRSSNYRYTFFRFYEPPYRCRYCNKRLPKDKVEVDHLIPVGMAKKYRSARFLLRIRGINNVNDVRNLVPSCHRCNEQKRDKLGLWYIKGVLGKYSLYWIIKYILKAAFWACIIYLIYKYYPYISDQLSAFLQ